MRDAVEERIASEKTAPTRRVNWSWSTRRRLRFECAEKILNPVARRIYLMILCWCSRRVHTWASSGATFTLGLSAEYLSDSQEYGHFRERSNLRPFSGRRREHLVDPDYMTFDASVAKTLSNQTISSGTTTSTAPVRRVARFFNNRAISLNSVQGRQGTDVTGLQQGAIVDGVGLSSMA